MCPTPNPDAHSYPNEQIKRVKYGWQSFLLARDKGTESLQLMDTGQWGFLSRPDLHGQPVPPPYDR